MGGVELLEGADREQPALFASAAERHRRLAQPDEVERVHVVGRRGLAREREVALEQRERLGAAGVFGGELQSWSGHGPAC